MQNFSSRQIDRYRILERLGMGGMAVVYKAYDTRLVYPFYLLIFFYKSLN